MRINTSYFLVIVLAIGLIGIIAVTGADGKTTSSSSRTERKALLIVSNITCMDSHEMGKMTSFHDHLVDQGWSGNDIEVLCPDKSPISEGIANRSNVDSGLKSISDSGSLNEVVIYISDHNTQFGNHTYFRFTDGLYSFDRFESHYDNMTYNRLTMIVNGNQSGLAGDPFSGPDRDVMCSMGAGQQFNPDQFNITRGLQNHFADRDNDGKVSYVEAFYSEYWLLRRTTSQVPRIWIN